MCICLWHTLDYVRCWLGVILSLSLSLSPSYAEVSCSRSWPRSLGRTAGTPGRTGRRRTRSCCRRTSRGCCSLTGQRGRRPLWCGFGWVGDFNPTFLLACFALAQLFISLTSWPRSVWCCVASRPRGTWTPPATSWWSPSRRCHRACRGSPSGSTRTLPRWQRRHAKWTLSRNMYTLHARFWHAWHRFEGSVGDY